MSERDKARFGLNDVSDTSTCGYVVEFDTAVNPGLRFRAAGFMYMKETPFDLAGTNHAGTSTEVRFASGKVGLAGDFNAESQPSCPTAEAPVRHQRPDG